MQQLQWIVNTRVMRIKSNNSNIKKIYLFYKNSSSVYSHTRTHTHTHTYIKYKQYKYICFKLGYGKD